MLIAAIALITSALVAYTTGVWAEHRRGTLTLKHLGWFSVGLLCDASGTLLMSRIAASSTGPAGLLTQIMAITGALALVLMIAHLLWAAIVLVRKQPAELRRFHKLSLAVWAIWLVPYFTGMAGSMIN